MRSHRPVTNVPSPRAFTLVEVMVVVTGIAVMAGIAMNSISDRVQRQQATEDSYKVLFPHTIARDRAAAAHSCVELMTLPAGSTGLRVRTWKSCDDHDNAVLRDEDFPLTSGITIGAWDTSDGRLVYGPDGGLVQARPSVAAGGAAGSCTNFPNGGLDGGGKGGGGGVVLGGGGGSIVGSCKAPKPSTLAPEPHDIHLPVTTFFGDVTQYVIYAVVGAAERLQP